MIDIGAGRGIISNALIPYCNNVFAYEVDRDLIHSLELIESPKFILRNENFLDTNINKINKPIKVFSNIPFFLTADILRKLFVENSNIDSGYIIMEKETAWRFIGKPYKKNSVISILIGLRYKARIIWEFKRTDFIPVPNANIVLVEFVKKGQFIFDILKCRDFIAYIFNERKGAIKNSLYIFWRYEKVKSILKSAGIKLNEKVSDLDVDGWLKVLNEFTKLPKEKQYVVTGEYAKLMRHQQKLNSDKNIAYNE